MRLIVGIFVLLLLSSSVKASQILVPMDNSQTNHLKAYGVAYYVLQNGLSMEWLLNYKGGSFLLPDVKAIENELVIRGVSYQLMSDGQVDAMKRHIALPQINQAVVKLDVAPKIAVYTPPGTRPWDDAVTMVMKYAEIPYDKIYDSLILTGGLSKYDWLHLHHEDFTGQYGKFYSAYRTTAWYQDEVRRMEQSAHNLGFNKVSKMKLAVAEAIKNFVGNGGFLFTMCSGTDSFDIALDAHNTDICDYVFDGDGIDPDYQSKMDFSNGFAFQNYQVITDPMIYEYSSIDGTKRHLKVAEQDDVFTLFDFSAKWDVVPTILTQDHTRIIKNFYGQTTDFVSTFIKSNVIVMGESKSLGTAKYIHGTYGKGTWTFYGGHDPEDYQHRVGDPPTDLNLHPNSPGYRLILNNILFPAVRKKKHKT